METFFWSLALAAVSGLTFAAYKHPKGFAENLFPPLLLLAILAAVVSVGWFMGGMNSLTESLLKEVASIKGDKGTLTFLVESVVRHFTQLKYGLGISLLVAISLLVLKHLPRILNLKQDSPNGSSSKTDA